MIPWLIFAASWLLWPVNMAFNAYWTSQLAMWDEPETELTYTELTDWRR